MLTGLSKWILFFVSYIPMLLCLMFNSFYTYLENKETNSIKSFLKESFFTIYKASFFICLIVIVVSLIFFIMIYFIRKRTTEHKNIEVIEHYNEAILNYMFVYIIPFIFTDVTLKNIILLVIVFFVVGSIQVKSDMVYINPTLYFFGYSTYQVNANEILISRHSIEDIKSKKIATNDQIKMVRLFEHVFIDCDKY